MASRGVSRRIHAWASCSSGVSAIVQWNPGPIRLFVTSCALYESMSVVGRPMATSSAHSATAAARGRPAVRPRGAQNRWPRGPASPVAAADLRGNRCKTLPPRGARDRTRASPSAVPAKRRPGAPRNPPGRPHAESRRKDERTERQHQCCDRRVSRIAAEPVQHDARCAFDHIVGHTPRNGKAGERGGCRVTEQRRESALRDRVGNDHSPVDERKQPSDERIERRRKRQREPRHGDGADRRCDAPKARHRHREEAKRGRHRVLRVVPHRSNQTVDTQPAELP